MPTYDITIPVTIIPLVCCCVLIILLVRQQNIRRQQMMGGVCIYLQFIHTWSNAHF